MTTYGTKQILEEDVIASSEFKNGLTNGISVLSDVLSYLDDLENNKTNIFLDLNKHLDNRSIAFEAMSKMDKNKRYYKHEFQKYLAFVADKQLQQFLVEKGITTNLHISVNNMNSFPSKFVVMNEDTEICSFDIFTQIFGRKHKEIDMDTFDKNIEHIETEISEVKKELVDLLEMKKKPMKYIFGPTDLYILLFKKRLLEEGFKKKINSRKNTLSALEKKLQEAKEYKPIAIEKNRFKIECFNLMEIFFNELNYKRIPDGEYTLY